MSAPEKKKGPRRVEVTGPEQDQPAAEAEDQQQAAEPPPPEDTEQAPVAEEAAEEPAAEEQEEATEEVVEEEAIEQQLEAATARIAELEGVIPELKEKCAYAEDQHLRLAAELQNYKQRVRKEKEQLVRFATESLVSELLPVLDNFERAMQVDADSPAGENLLAGVKMILDQLLQVLGSQGVEPIEALGEPFDPSLHEAVEREETKALPPDVVVAELARGYRMHDRVIRPSKVRVSARSSDEPSGDESEAE